MCIQGCVGHACKQPLRGCKRSSECMGGQQCRCTVWLTGGVQSPLRSPERLDTATQPEHSCLSEQDQLLRSHRPLERLQGPAGRPSSCCVWSSAAICSSSPCPAPPLLLPVLVDRLRAPPGQRAAAEKEHRLRSPLPSSVRSSAAAPSGISRCAGVATASRAKRWPAPRPCALPPRRRPTLPPADGTCNRLQRAAIPAHLSSRPGPRHGVQPSWGLWQGPGLRCGGCCR